MNGELLDELSRNEDVEQYRDFKLQLRPLMSLTDEEVRELARLDAGGDFRYGDVYQLDRYSDHISVYYGNGAGIHIYIDLDKDNLLLPQMIAYLQSLFVYVPGTIDPRYVDLMDS